MHGEAYIAQNVGIYIFDFLIYFKNNPETLEKH